MECDASTKGHCASGDIKSAALTCGCVVSNSPIQCHPHTPASVQNTLSNRRLCIGRVHSSLPGSPFHQPLRIFAGHLIASRIRPFPKFLRVHGASLAVLASRAAVASGTFAAPHECAQSAFPFVFCFCALAANQLVLISFAELFDLLLHKLCAS